MLDDDVDRRAPAFARVTLVGNAEVLDALRVERQVLLEVAAQ
jgi:hypothetical protein